MIRTVGTVRPIRGWGFDRILKLNNKQEKKKKEKSEITHYRFPAESYFVAKCCSTVSDMMRFFTPDELKDITVE